LYFVLFSAGLWATAGLLPLIGVSFAFAILLVNQDLEMFHYVFAAFCFSQVYVFVFKRKVAIQGRNFYFNVFIYLFYVTYFELFRPRTKLYLN